MQGEHLTVEIFRDADRRDVSIEAAELGVEQVRRITTGIEIVRATRLLRIARLDQQAVRSDNINWPKLEADMNIILTDRPLFNGSGIQEYGHATTMRGAAQFGAAIINVQGPDYPAPMVAHEFGHLFDVKKAGATWDGDQHCTDNDCFMQIYPSETKIIPTRVRTSGIKNLMERYGYRTAEYEDTKTSSADRFCEECAAQIDKKSFFLKKAKAGESVPIE